MRCVHSVIMRTVLRENVWHSKAVLGIVFASTLSLSSFIEVVSL